MLTVKTLEGRATPSAKSSFGTIVVDGVTHTCRIEKMHPLEEVDALLKMKVDDNLTGQQIADLVDLSRTSVTLRLGIAKMEQALLDDIRTYRPAPSVGTLIEISLADERLHWRLWNLYKEGGFTRVKMRSIKVSDKKAAGRKSCMIG